MNIEFEWDARKARANRNALGGFDSFMHGARRKPNGNTMKKTSRQPRRATRTDDVRPEYQFDYSRSRSNRFAATLGPQTVAVVLEPDVARVFDSSRSVNTLLRSVIAAVPSADHGPRASRRKAG
jgi:hypothetical protein